jgi:hypothetical protein
MAQWPDEDKVKERAAQRSWITSRLLDGRRHHERQVEGIVEHTSPVPECAKVITSEAAMIGFRNPLPDIQGN